MYIGEGMMIELRWLHKIGSKEPPRLQYRQMENILELGIQEPIWSDWFDIPEIYTS